MIFQRCFGLLSRRKCSFVVRYTIHALHKVLVAVFSLILHIAGIISTFECKDMDDQNIVQAPLLGSIEDEGGDLKGRILEESKKIWKVAAPSVLSRASSFGTVIVTQSFIGHISSSDLSGFGLVQALTVQLANGVLLGMSSATETLCGQAYGAKQYHMMGTYLQRSWVIELITTTILLPLFIFAKLIFYLFGEEEEVVESAGYVSLWFIPYIYGDVFTFTIQMFLQAQQKNVIVAWLALLQFVIHIFLSWVFVIVLDFGTPGAMTALCISTWFFALGEFLYVIGGWCSETWTGFTVAATKDLLPILKLSISSGLMVCLEIWYCAILVLLAGYMKNAEVAISTFSICYNITSWILMIMFGLMGAACVRIANELGRGDVRALKFSIKVLISTSSMIGIFFWIVCLVFRNRIGYFFTDDEEVVQSISDLSLLLAFTVLLCSIAPVFSGVAVGAGLQSKVAVINLMCYYLIGVPIGAVLGYVVHLQVKGLWIGLICGIVTQTLTLSIMVWRTNWDEEVLKTSARLEGLYLKTSDENGQGCDRA